MATTKLKLNPSAKAFTSVKAFSLLNPDTPAFIPQQVEDNDLKILEMRSVDIMSGIHSKLQELDIRDANTLNISALRNLDTNQIGSPLSTNHSKTKPIKVALNNKETHNEISPRQLATSSFTLPKQISPSQSQSSKCQENQSKELITATHNQFYHYSIQELFKYHKQNRQKSADWPKDIIFQLDGGGSIESIDSNTDSNSTSTSRNSSCTVRTTTTGSSSHSIFSNSSHEVSSSNSNNNDILIMIVM